jgi:hypothetical protein
LTNQAIRAYDADTFGLAVGMHLLFFFDTCRVIEGSHLDPKTQSSDHAL